MPESRFVYVTYIRTTPDKLWNALIDPEFTKRYWVEMWQESNWTPGAEWIAKVPGGTVTITGKIIESDRPRKLVLTWRDETKDDLVEEGFSRLTYELEQVGDSVKLTILHEIDKPESKLIRRVSGGWPLILSSLKSMLETGEPLEATKSWAACA